MDISRLRQFINNLDVNEVDSVSVKLVQKINADYEVYEPTVRRPVREDLKNLYSEVFQTRLFELPQEDYNPNLGQDGYLSIANLDVAHVNRTIIELESEENIHGDMAELDLETINFYCIRLEHDNKCAYIFRRFTKMKKIRQGILGILEDNSLRKVNNELFIGLDRDIDILVFENEMLIINRFALQTIFNLQDYFTDRATEALQQIQRGNVIENFDEFREDCLNDRQASKRITKIINTPGRIEGFLEMAHLLPYVIAEADLDIELNENGQIVYTRNRQVRSQILFCIADGYYLSLMLGRVGEDIS
ncbi:Kiwa anti-phage protein KwaB-like domain-containing protein [Sporosarcina sp. 179-K 8C2 HS]|uniref:Kiwa anti-phage protein KwaB-like domain-containing protein n=1 Tax=Sporosarcina sp. 179-K 8C2 HS TaxID=3142387 RepID=UPI0039A2FCC3